MRALRQSYARAFACQQTDCVINRTHQQPPTRDPASAVKHHRRCNDRTIRNQPRRGQSCRPPNRKLARSILKKDADDM